LSQLATFHLVTKNWSLNNFFFFVVRPYWRRGGCSKRARRVWNFW